MTHPQISALARRHNPRYKLVRSKQWPEVKWHIAQWQSHRHAWQNIIVNVSLDRDLTALAETGSITPNIR